MYYMEDDMYNGHKDLRHFWSSLDRTSFRKYFLPNTIIHTQENFQSKTLINEFAF